MCIHMDLMSCLSNAHAKHGFRCIIKKFRDNVVLVKC